MARPTSLATHQWNFSVNNWNMNIFMLYFLYELNIILEQFVCIVQPRTSTFGHTIYGTFYQLTKLLHALIRSYHLLINCRYSCSYEWLSVSYIFITVIFGLKLFHSLIRLAWSKTRPTEPRVMQNVTMRNWMDTFMLVVIEVCVKPWVHAKILQVSYWNTTSWAYWGLVKPSVIIDPGGGVWSVM